MSPTELYEMPKLAAMDALSLIISVVKVRSMVNKWAGEGEGFKAGSKLKQGAYKRIRYASTKTCHFANS